MCGRFAIIPGDMRARYNLAEKTVDITPNYNAAPGQFLPVIIKAGVRNQMKLMKWGLIPAWAKDDKIGYKMINARSETLLEKPSFKKPFMERRCLVPISGFYEWKKLDEKHKIPFFIHLKDDQIVSLAGIYDVWLDKFSGQEVYSFSIITTSANEQMEDIHERMPVIIQKQDEAKYLESRPEEAYELLKPSSEKLDIYEVSSLVNSPKNNSEDLIKKIQAI